ncbi:MAG TPA: NUDIX domain-containing protein [Candidatus Absconditabacterales bacterium]|nr:NUDIX domain-containing protein [Candidatus Absconditabacterales bacterium]HMT26810.1 NUDIX domain-containing protein [Candidatus Absconditabacterales bacterium]
MIDAIITEEILGVEETIGLSIDDCKIRQAVRIIIFHDNKIAIIKTGKGFLMIPGGGVDEGETKEEAAYRESMEETGCEIVNLRYLGQIVENRLRNQQIATTYAFIANAKNLGGLNLEADEIEEGHELIRMSLDEAYEKISELYNISQHKQGRSVSMREKIILAYVMENLENL